MCFCRCLQGTVSLAVLLGLALLPNLGQADDRPTGKAKTSPEVVRLVYPVQGGSAKELAEVLKPHFRSSSFLALPATSNNKLVLSGTKDDVEDAMRLLRELDRPAQTLHVEVFLVEMTAKGAGATELSGPIGKVAEKLVKLQQQGMIAGVQRIEVSVLEGDTAKCLIGAYKPYVTGVTATAGLGAFGGGGFGAEGGAAAGGIGSSKRKGTSGKEPGKSDEGPVRRAPGAGGPLGDGPARGIPRVSRTVNYRNLGTQVQIMKPEIARDGTVELQIQVSDSQVRKSSGGVELVSDEKGGVSATEFTQFTFEDRLRIPRGNVVTAQATQTNSRNNQGQTLILVGVRAD